ncbi:transcriptional regulator, ArsR family [Clostridium amylolyticum]|uniref:Transcriptional regulator, ArsR family n=1 Tax=Clostridium amylolyticum TaxID=1121298 RepID=A0A1M6P0I3_9CLOT|nr:metalloregulator ArsR/SmtB family transcription factor [Clostridium amylolyticum]SHK01499.1 transcriptional regulator, ArsR family [Clostridium amylolyticum]
MNLMQVIKALGDETRMRILNILKDGELCVCEIEVILGINQSNASRHLNKLTNAKILDYRKVAKYVYYKLNEDTMREYHFIKEVIQKNTMESKYYKKDNERLKRYRASGLTCDELKDGKLCFN